MSVAKVVFNQILGAWYVVIGPRHAPISGSFKSKEEAKQWLDARGGKKGSP